MDLFYIQKHTNQRIFLNGVKAKNRKDLAQILGGQFLGDDGEIYLISEVQAMNIFHLKGFFPLLVAVFCTLLFAFPMEWHISFLYVFFLVYVLADSYTIKQAIKVNDFNFSKPN